MIYINIYVHIEILTPPDPTPPKGGRYHISMEIPINLFIRLDYNPLLPLISHKTLPFLTHLTSFPHETQFWAP